MPTSTRERLLKAAKHLFAARGYEHAGTAAVASLAGTSESQLVKHFGSKAGLLLAVFTEGWLHIIETAQQKMKGLDSPLEKLRVIARSVVECMNEDPELKLLLLLEGRRVRGEGHKVVLTEGFQNFVLMMDGVLEEIRAAGLLRPGLPPQAVRSALIGMLEGLMRDQFLAERAGFPAAYNTHDLSLVLGLGLRGFMQDRGSVG